VTPEPARTLAREARWVWLGEQLLGWGVAIVVGMVIAAQVNDVIALALRLVPIIGLLVCAPLVPWLRWRRWRWDVRPDAIDIRHGTVTIRRTLVPMRRVQHVDTRRGLFEQAFDLATVVVHTAAGSHEIPLLRIADADEVRDRIAELARTADEP
jgi:membrane protein YdbS with pleckstrin-like domain